MKLFATILASLMLSLFLFAGSANARVKASVAHFTTGNSSDQQSSHEQTDCTPFCAFCSCCQVVETKPLAMSVAITKEVAHVSISGTVNNKPKDVSLPVWRPPQLS